MTRVSATLPAKYFSYVGIEKASSRSQMLSVWCGGLVLKCNLLYSNQSIVLFLGVKSSFNECASIFSERVMEVCHGHFSNTSLHSRRCFFSPARS